MKRRTITHSEISPAPGAGYLTSIHAHTWDRDGKEHIHNLCIIMRATHQETWDAAIAEVRHRQKIEDEREECDIEHDCDTCRHDAGHRCTAPTTAHCEPQDGRPLWEPIADVTDEGQIAVQHVLKDPAIAKARGEG